MNDLRSLLLDAGSAALGVEKAKAALELAKQQVEAAKSSLDDAKSAFEAAIEQCESAGLTKAKARKAAEQLNQVFAEVGAIEIELPEQPVSATADAEKPARKKRRSKADEGEDSAAAPVGNEEASAFVEGTSAPETVPQEEAQPARDNDASDEAVEEIKAVIEGILSRSDPRQAAAADLLLDTLSAARAVSSAEGPDLDLESFRAFLELAISDPVSAGIADLPFVKDSGDEAIRVLSWFEGIIGVIEDGKEPTSLYQAEEATVPHAADENVQDDVAEMPMSAHEEPEEVSSEHDYVTEDEPDLIGMEDEYPDFPDLDEVSVSDDASFPLEADSPLDDAEEGEVVENIGEINFLDEGKPEEAESTQVEEQLAPAPTKVEAPPAEPEKAKPTRGTFAPPAFLKKG